ncbi:hypothetical protein HmCmsJML035_02787 [Escherichia coli]|nr:hypothetical protein HmCmsJML035_02787 [Escherichia coli]
MAFAQVADFSQPAVAIILPLLCRVAVHRPVRDAVCFIVVPLRDLPLILAADELPCGAVPVTLCPAIKAALLRQAVQHIVGKFTPAAVLVGQHGDAPGSVIPHAARQPAFRHTHRTPAFIICDGAAFTVR